MRIAIDARAVGVYPGLGRYAVELLKPLVRLRQGDQFVVFLRDGVEPPFAAPNIEWCWTRVRLLSPLNLIGFAGTLRSLRFDVFHALFQAAPVTPRLHDGTGCAPLVVTVHDLMDLNYDKAYAHHPRWKQVLLRAYFRSAIPPSIAQAAALICVSEATAQDLRELFPRAATKVHVIHEAAAEMFFHHRHLGIPEAATLDLPARFFLYFGSTKAYKNVDGLLAGYAEYAHRMKSIQQEPLPLVIAGLKDVVAIRDRPVPNWLRQHLRFPGAIPDDALPELYRRAEALVFLSEREGFGLPLVEAMAMGCPIVGADRSAVREVVAGGGVLIPDEPPVVAETLRRVADDATFRSDLVHRARLRSNAFSWEVAAQATSRVYDAVGRSHS